MGFLKKLFGTRAVVQQLPSGSVTVNQRGQVITSTVSSAYPPALLREIGREVLGLFREAREAQMPLAEVSIHYASLRVTARELRGGAIIFLFPQTALLPAPQLTCSHERQRTQPTHQPDRKPRRVLETVQPLHRGRPLQKIRDRRTRTSFSKSRASSCRNWR